MVCCGARTDAHEEEEDEEDVEDGHEGQAERRDDLLERPAAFRVRFTVVLYSFHSRLGSVSQPFWIRFAAEAILLISKTCIILEDVSHRAPFLLASVSRARGYRLGGRAGFDPGPATADTPFLFPE